MSAKKFLALAITAFRAKQYEDAGVLFAQASAAEGADELVAELTATPGEIVLDGSNKPNDVDQKPETETEGGEDEGGEKPAGDESTSADWGDEGEEESDTISVSSVGRRRTTSLFQIGKILSASMQSLSDDGGGEEETDEDDEDEEDDAGVPEVDPDYPGQLLVPASFSSVRIKSQVVDSPIKLKK